METFFNSIYGNSEGFIDIVTRSDDGDLVSERWFEWPNDKSAVLKYCTVRSDEDVYCSVAVFSDELRSKEDVNAVTRTVYADADSCHPSNFRIPPSIVVETSPDRWHCWWVLDEEVPAKDASEAAHRLSEAHKDQGIDRGWIISKLLRVPGTTNTKYEDAFEVTAEYSGEVFTLDTINDVYGDIETNPTVDLNAAVPKPLPRKDRIALEQQLDAAGLSSLYLEKPMEGQSWSERAYKLELELFRLGMTAQEIFTLMRESACNKYNPENSGELTQTGVRIPKRRNPDEVLWREVLKAQAEYEATAYVEVEETNSKKVTKADFLSTEERRFCQEHPTFVNRYVDWVASRSDSAPTYQHSLAYMLLSCGFGGRGYIPLPWGKAPLNIWVLILGDTTRTRKSTARALFVQAVHLLETQIGEQIDIGSEATSEALVVELGQRDGKVSLFHRDEFQGFLSEIMTKAYRSGTIDTLTDLYDGKVPVTLRATKDAGNKNRAHVVFNLVGVGIRKRVGHILTKEFFESGFLARMLWSVADPPPRKKGSEDVWFEENASRFDPVLDDLVDDLAKRVNAWSLDKPASITLDQASLNRYNRWLEETMQVVERYGDGDILIPSFDRMAKSVLKATALLAMYDQKEVATMAHLLPALQQAELWFNDMVRMASEVASSEFERRLDEIVAHITTGADQQMLDSSVRRKFAKLRPREMEEALSALVAQGRIRKSKDARQKWEVL